MKTLWYGTLCIWQNSSECNTQCVVFFVSELLHAYHMACLSLQDYCYIHNIQHNFLYDGNCLCPWNMECLWIRTRALLTTRSMNYVCQICYSHNTQGSVCVRTVTHIKHDKSVTSLACGILFYTSRLTLITEKRVNMF